MRNAGNILPLAKNEISAIAVIGENAKWAQIRGGGSADVTPHCVVSPLEGIELAVGDAVRVKYANERLKAWVAEAGSFEVLVGASSQDIRLSRKFEWKEEYTQ